MESRRNVPAMRAARVSKVRDATCTRTTTMSDESPPPKPKVGSLRDRIAAFEKKPADPAAPPPAPAPRPKPSQWKPKTASPPSSPPRAAAAAVGGDDEEHKHAVRAGMSAADAKESIVIGGSLKERMAALQGRGGFGAPAPPAPPKPASDRPKWKPPPPVHAPEEDQDDQEHSEREREHAKSPVPSVDAASISEATDGEKSATQEEGAESEADPEEEERKRRAAIAARMARLGGARFGMGPPIFAPKPHTKKSVDDAKSPTEEAVTGSNESVHSTDAPAVSAESEEKSPSHAADSADEISEPHALKVGLPDAPSQTSLVSVDSASSSARSPPTTMPVPAGPRRSKPPRRRPPKSPLPSNASLPETPIDTPTEITPETAASLIAPEHEGSREVDVTSADFPSPPVRDEKKLEEDELAEPAAAADNEEDDPDASTGLKNEATSDEAAEPEPEKEEDVAARRKRIAERIAKSGGFNPFSEAVPRKDSLETAPAPSTKEPASDYEKSGSVESTEAVEEPKEDEENATRLLS
ncbi:hypothetical protein DFH11DRAFT_303981 [Phellopilus nigrolimitatus]|nr:hypothetical protein DFH11DRAFT_303981 [Phellopilus nigrolimitatus]